ncbi:unnamed protein product [Caenorhabditis nigoni]
MKLIRKYHVVPYENGVAVESAKRFLETILNDPSMDASTKSRFYQDLLFRIRNLQDIPIVNDEVMTIVQDNYSKHMPSVPKQEVKQEVKPEVKEEAKPEVKEEAKPEPEPFPFGTNYEQHEVKPKGKKHELKKERFDPFVESKVEVKPQIPIHPLPQASPFAPWHVGGPVLPFRNFLEHQYHPYFQRPVKKRIMKKAKKPNLKRKKGEEEEEDGPKKKKSKEEDEKPERKVKKEPESKPILKRKMKEEPIDTFESKPVLKRKIKEEPESKPILKRKMKEEPIDTYESKPIMEEKPNLKRKIKMEKGPDSKILKRVGVKRKLPMDDEPARKKAKRIEKRKAGEPAGNDAKRRDQIDHPCAFTSVENVYKFLKPKFKTLKLAKVEKVLEDLEAFTLHRPNQTRFPRIKTTAAGLYTDLQMDLADVSKYKASNDGITFLLVVIDIYSRRLFVRTLKSKAGKDVCPALASVFEEMDATPITIYSDDGKEFYNSQVQKMLDDKHVKLVSPKSELKCAVVERANRTLKTRLAKYMTHKYGHRYVDVLEKVVKGINNTVNRGIGKKPVDVQHGDFFVPYMPKGSAKIRFSKGDHVRIASKRGHFDKGYEQGWTTEIYVISQVHPGKPVKYNIVDTNGEPVVGSFYTRELTKCTYDANGQYRIEKVLDERIVRGKKQVLVRWEGYGPEFDSWIDGDGIISL